MQRRIFRTEEAQDAEQHIQSQSAPAENRLNALIQAGIVTHQIRNPDRLDPMFAVAQMHDLPEVSFVAAFQDGLIALGCPNGPPDSLSHLVKPVAAVAKNAAASASLETRGPLLKLIGDLDTRHAKAEADVAGLSQQMGLVSKRLEHVLDAMKSKVADAQKSPPPPVDDSKLIAVAQMVKALHQKLDRKQEPDSTTSSAISRIEACVAGLSDRALDQSATMQATLSELDSKLGGIAEKLPEIPETPDESGPQLVETLAQIETRIDDLSGAVGTVNTSLTDLQTKKDPDSIDRTALAQTVAALDTRFEKMLNSPGQQRRQTALMERLDEVHALLERPDPASNEMLEMMRAMQGQIPSLADRSEVAAAWSEQRSGFKKLDADIGLLLQHNQDTASQTEVNHQLLKMAADDDGLILISEKIDALATRTAATMKKGDLDQQVHKLSAEIAALPGQLAPVTDHPVFTNLNNSLSDIGDSILKVANAPVPTVDVTEQQRGFASFTTAMSAVARKFEATADRIGHQATKHNYTDTLADIVTRLQELPKQLLDNVPPTADLSKLETRLDDLGQQAENHNHADILTDIVARLQKLPQELLDNVPPTADLSKLETRLDDLGQQAEKHNHADILADIVASLQELPQQLLDNVPPTADLSKLETRLDDLGQQTADLADPVATMNAMARKFEATADRIGHQTEKHNYVEILADIAARLQELPKQLLDNVPPTIDLSKLEDRLDDLGQQTAGLADPVATMSAQLDRFTATSGTESATVNAQLDAIFERLASPLGTPVDLSPLVAKLDQLEAQYDVVPTALAELKVDVMQAATRPAPGPDLSEQSADLERIGATMGTAVSQMQLAVAEMGEQQVGSLSNAAELSEMMQALPTVVKQTLEQTVDLEPIHQIVSQMQRDLAPLPDRIAGVSTLKDAVDALTRRPDPVLDLTEQRQGFARFGTALSEGVSRMEDVAAQFAMATQTVPDFAPLTDGIAEIRIGVGSLATAMPTLSEGLNTLVQRQDPTLKIGEQQRELARFCETSSTAMDRIEERLSQLPTTGDTKARLVPFVDGIADMRDQLSTLSNEVPAFSETMRAFAQRPDPKLDLTEQRHEFARFDKNFGAALIRLEKVASQVDASQGKNSDLSSVAAELTNMRRHLSVVAASQNAKVASLGQQVATLCDTIQTPVPPKAANSTTLTPKAQTPDSHEKLDNMRFQFAELVATQIKKNATATADI